jgi:hypothetical protein
MRLLRIAAASTAVGLALTATAALAQVGYPGMPGYGPPGPYGAPYGPPGAMPGYPPGPPGIAPAMPPPDPSQAGQAAGPYASTSPMLPPGAASQGGTPLVDPSQIYGGSSGQQGLPSPDAAQAYPGSAQGIPPAGAMPGMPGTAMAGPMGPNGPMPGQSAVNAVPGLPPLANTQAPLPPGSVMGPQAMAQAQGLAPSAGPSGVASMQASPVSQQATPPNQGGVSTDTVRVVDTADGSISLDPTPIRYPVNRQITWMNNSSAIIQLTSEDGSTFDSGPLAPGDSYSYTPNLIGSVYYRDKLHPWVRGVVVAIQER